MSDQLMFENLAALHREEEKLREEAQKLITQDPGLQLHISAIANAMNVAEQFRILRANDEDIKAVQGLGIRAFNALAASVKLGLSGYWADCVLNTRLVLETAFLIDFFHGDRSSVASWRHADAKEKRKKYSPAAIRKALDERDQLIGKKRQHHYGLLSTFAAHPTMESMALMKPQTTNEVRIGPFMEAPFLKNILFEIARIALLFADSLDNFFPETGIYGGQAQEEYQRSLMRWRSVNDPRVS